MKKVIALKYNRKQDAAPQVIAKGKGIVADKIMDIAKKENIVIYEDEELVEQLMQYDMGENIPAELYEAVAGVLAYVYSIDGNDRNGK